MLSISKFGFKREKKSFSLFFVIFNTILIVRNYDTGTQLFSFEDHQDTVTALTFDHKGNFLVSGSGEYEINECAIKVWDLKKGELKTTKGSHWMSISSLSFSPNGEYLVSGAYDKTINSQKNAVR